MIYNGAFADTKYYGLLAVAGLWVVVIILQVLFSLFTKSKNGRAMFAMVITLVVVIGGAVFFDIYAEKKFAEIESKHAAYGVSMKSYKHQINYYVPITSGKSGMAKSYANDINRFCSVYNVGEGGKCYSDDYNIDGSVPTYDKERDAYFSPNGMYADGYVFSMDEAINILITYHETRSKYAKLGEDADVELSAAITQARQSSEYIEYTQTEEYQNAYNTEDGTAFDHMLTIEQVDEILMILGSGLGDALNNLDLITAVLPAAIQSYLPLINEDLSIDALVDLINNLELNTVISLLGFEEDLMDMLYAALLPIIQNVTLPTTTLQFDTVENFSTSLNQITVKNLLAQLDFDKVNGLVGNFGLDLSDFEILFTDGLTKDFVENIVNELALTSNLFFYQSPTVKPVFYFIEDETLKEYAYAKYYATVHGKNVGSVLIGDNIGEVTFSSSGNPSSQGFSLKELYQLRMDREYMPQAYPLFAARRYMYIMGGIMAIMMALYYHNARKQDEAFMQLTGGRR